MRCKLSFVALAIAVSVVAAMASSATASTVTGVTGDGKPSIVYNYSTGGWGVQTDGQPVGLFDILSDVPIFNSTPASLPSGGLFTTDVNTEKAWASLGGAFAFTTDLSLGLISAPGLTSAFLNQHLTITYSAGFGTPNKNGDVFVGDSSFEPHFNNATINNVDPEHPGFVEYTLTQPSNAGTFGNLQFDSYVPAPGVTGSGPVTPATFDAAQRKFHWDTVGSPLGTYQWSVTATNVFGSGTGTITVNVTVPEPATLASLVMASVVCVMLRRR